MFVSFERLGLHRNRSSRVTRYWSTMRFRMISRRPYCPSVDATYPTLFVIQPVAPVRFRIRSTDDGQSILGLRRYCDRLDALQPLGCSVVKDFKRLRRTTKNGKVGFSGQPRGRGSTQRGNQSEASLPRNRREKFGNRPLGRASSFLSFRSFGIMRAWFTDCGSGSRGTKPLGVSP